jgi:hypothetical protein
MDFRRDSMVQVTRAIKPLRNNLNPHQIVAERGDVIRVLSVCMNRYQFWCENVLTGEKFYATKDEIVTEEI